MSVHLDLGDVNARRAIDAAADAPLLAIIGPAASGKTETLARRYVALLERDSAITVDSTIITASHAASAAVLADRIRALLPPGAATEQARDSRYFGRALATLAFDVLADHAAQTGLAYDLEAIDVYDAEEIFERAIAPLFAADWSEYLGPDIDPEIPGLRAPDRFAVAVLALVRKLRDAQIGPDAFLKAALRGATEFYAKPPNLSAPALLYATKDEHRGALTVDAAERERQRRREIDLAKIIAKLYRSYLAQLVAHGCLTDSDAVAEATRLLTEQPAIARTYRRRFALAMVDDVHDLSTGEFRFLQAIFGADLQAVTVAGDPNAATQTFAGSRPERIFAVAATTLQLQANYRVPAPIAASIRALLDPARPAEIPPGDELRLHRAVSQADEAAFVAASVGKHIADGVPPGRIAVVHRSLRTLAVYENALLDMNIPIALCGDGALFDRHDTLDALAVLWSVVDPFRHAWLLRVLQLPPLELSDATVALLCGEPASTQALLFDLPPSEETDGSRRWDRRRDLRLGSNVVRGDRDVDLGPQARERIAEFRRRRTRWQMYLRTATVDAAVRAIITDAELYTQRPSETAARTRRRQTVIDTLLDVIARYAGRHPGDDLASALSYCERIARGARGPVIDDRAGDAVVVASIDRIRARRFDHVFVVDVRAGSFPPYYVPDAFLFSPVHGMIPKDSVGDAITARTAKFTWYAHHAKLRDTYGREDRRALTVALARADVTATVSTSGRATRGVGAPELFVELQALRPPPRLVEVPVEKASADKAVFTHTAPDPQPTSDDDGPPAIAAERVAAMVACVQCAPRTVVGRTIDAGLSLLSGRATSDERTVAERDVHFAFTLGRAIVYGVVPAFVIYDGRPYVAVAQSDCVAAALAINGVRHRVADTAFFIETADGGFEGPHPIIVDDLLAQTRSVLDGSYSPRCSEHRLRATQ